MWWCRNETQIQKTAKETVDNQTVVYDLKHITQVQKKVLEGLLEKETLVKIFNLNMSNLGKSTLSGITKVLKNKEV